MKAWMLMITFGLTAVCGFGQSDDKTDGVSFWDAKIVKVNYEFFGGMTLNYQGQDYPIFSGLKPYLADILKADPLVKPLIQGYQTKQAVSSGLFWGGLVSAIGGIVVIGLPASYTGHNGEQITGVGITGIILAAAGDVSMLSSPFVTVSSYEDIFEGVNIYNRDQMKTLK